MGKREEKKINKRRNLDEIVKYGWHVPELIIILITKLHISTRKILYRTSLAHKSTIYIIALRYLDFLPCASYY